MCKSIQIALSCLIFILAYNAFILIGHYDLLPFGLLKLLGNSCIFGFSISTVLFALSNHKSKSDIRWLKICTLILFSVFGLITANNFLNVSNIESLVIEFNFITFLLVIFFIFKADKYGNI